MSCHKQPITRSDAHNLLLAAVVFGALAEETQAIAALYHKHSTQSEACLYTHILRKWRNFCVHVICHRQGSYKHSEYLDSGLWEVISSLEAVSALVDPAALRERHLRYLASTPVQSHNRLSVSVSHVLRVSMLKVR